MNRQEKEALNRDNRHPEGRVVDSRIAGDDGGDTLGSTGGDTSNEAPASGNRGGGDAQANAARLGIPTRTAGSSPGNPQLIPGVGGAAGGSTDRDIESSVDVGAESSVRGSRTVIPETGSADTTGGTGSVGGPKIEDPTHGEQDRKDKFKV